jgi:type IV pilus assembly protein PilP
MKNSAIHLKFLLPLAMVFVLGGCAKSDSDLLVWINQVKNRPAPPLEPLPTIQDQPVIAYMASGKRDPFATPPMSRTASGVGPRPDMNRPRQPLEAFTLDGLSMVGTIGSGDSLMGLILAPDKVTYKVRPGNYVGESDGRVVAIYPDRIDLIELVPNADGWLERPAEIALTDSKDGEKK